jgi:beta-1,4-mannosyltransferase
MSNGRRSPVRVLCFPKQGGNAYLNQLSSHLEAAGLQVDEFSFPRAFTRRYDVLHIHWPETHLRSPSWWRALGKHLRLGLLFVLLRLRGTRIVWMLHNLRSHDRNHWIGAFLFPRWFPRLCTHVIALTPSGLELAHMIHPALRHKPAAIIPHGHYRDVYPQPPSRKDCRAALGVPPEPFTFVYFGYIRRYKNVALLAEVFRRLRDSGVQLIIAGEPVVGMRAEDVETAAQKDSRIHLFLRHIRDDEVPTFLGAADLVVTPFSEVLNSGSVMLALSMNRPVLAPRVGALPDLERIVGRRWLRLYEGVLDAPILARARADFAQRAPHETVDLSAFDWPAIASATVELYTRPRHSVPVNAPVPFPAPAPGAGAEDEPSSRREPVAVTSSATGT